MNLYQFEAAGAVRNTGIRLAYVGAGGTTATAEVNLHGATLTSWKVGDEELLFVRYAPLHASRALRLYKIMLTCVGCCIVVFVVFVVVVVVVVVDVVVVIVVVVVVAASPT